MAIKFPPFSDRVIFDHLPKTAGQAVNAWLRDELGDGAVTSNLIGQHKSLVRQYGGEFSIISGHLSFVAGEGLDPRYQYLTLLREPIDRALSWIYYLTENVSANVETRALIEGAQAFLSSNGAECNEQFLASLTNPYVEHFWKASTYNCNDEEAKLEAAMKTLQNYAVVGLYESMPRFLADVADLIGLPRPAELMRVNVTSKRLEASEISPKLSQRLIELNRLDIELYQLVKSWKEEQWTGEITPPAPRTQVRIWSKYEHTAPRWICSDDILVDQPTLRQDYEIEQGQLMVFEVPITVMRRFAELEIGIHIWDSNKNTAFGINSTLLKRVMRNVAPGEYCVLHYVVAELPAGNFTAGFAFAERLETGASHELFWTDVAIKFRVLRKNIQNSAGYLDLSAEINLIRVGGS